MKTNDTLDLKDFEVIGSAKEHHTIPVMTVYATSIYFNKFAVEKIGMDKDDRLTFLRKGDVAYVAIPELLGKTKGYKINSRFTIASSSLLRIGLVKVGNYLIGDPVHVSGIDLFELIPIEK